MDAATMLDWFVRNLTPTLYKEVYIRQPTTLRAAYEMAARLEGMFHVIASKTSSSSSALNAMDDASENENATIRAQLSQLMQQQQQLMAFTQQRVNNNNGGSNKNKLTNDEKDKLVCDHCGKKRHTKEQCFKLHPELKPEWMKAKQPAATISKK